MTVVSRYIPLAVVTLFLMQFAPVPASAQLASGPGSFVFRDLTGNPDKPLTVWYYRPRQASSRSPILFVMHGLKRDGEVYRDAWIKYAEKYQTLLLVPEFSDEHYPGSEMYNLGNMWQTAGRPAPRSRWTFAVIEHLFDHVKALTGNTSSEYVIYGHSAGGQFVHRLVLFMPEARFRVAVAANAGYYTMPTFDVTFPHGLQRAAITAEGLKQSFARKLVILLGEEDVNHVDKNFPKDREAMAQGRTRLERGQAFFRAAQMEAGRMGLPLNWELQTVPGVAHSNHGMAKEAQRLLFR